MDFMKFKWEDKLKEFRERRDKVMAMGGEKAVERQHKRNKLTARERIEKFFEPDTFVENYEFIKKRVNDFGLEKKEIAADGVVTGYGKVNGRYVCVWSQDFTAHGGTMGEQHGFKVSEIINRAMWQGIPVVGMMDSGGARLQEGMQAGHLGYGRIIMANVQVSGVIPQFALVMGNCGGGGGYLPALHDICFMVREKGTMFIGGPHFCKTVIGEDATVEELGGSNMHSQVTGICDLQVDDDEECLEKTKELLSFLPSSCNSPIPVVNTGDNPNRKNEKLLDIVPADHTKSYDMHRVIEEIVDNGHFFEIKPEYAKNLIIGFARFGGTPVGLMANQPNYLAGCFDVEAGTKIARFIRFCNAFNIPLVSLTDTPAYLVGTDQEQKGVIKHGCKGLFAYAEADVPKINIVLRKAYAGGYANMGNKSMGCDVVLAWPTAVLIIVVPEGAIDVFYPRGKFSEEVRLAELEKYYKDYINPWFMAERGFIDGVIEPEDTRMRIIKALHFLKDKKVSTPKKKLGNIYL
ncbi:MAG: acyl-CoA carboxylase subunit beta [Thermodesulfobacteriota bacterium]|nr:acyl-CoA carboxylase subunit beta [Thermodesulfobacteriota bacterium]